jgi:putative copper export protein
LESSWLQISMVVLRILHIGSGIFWVGSIAFLTLLLEPHLRAQGPGAMRRTMGPMLPVMGPTLLGASLVTVASGATMILILGRNDYGIFFSTPWGLTILFGGAMGVLALIVGDGLVRLQRWRLDALGAQLAERVLQGDPPGREAAQRVARIESRLWLIGKINFGLLVLAVLAMATARYA